MLNLQGKYEYVIKTANIEKLIYELKNKRIDASKVKSKGEEVTIVINYKDLDRFEKVLEKMKLEFQIRRASGLSVIYEYFMSHILFLILILCSILIPIFLSLFLWNIDIKGLEYIDQKQIEEFLDKQNIKVGMLKSNIRTNDLKNQLQIEFRNVSFASFDIEGVKLNIKIIDYDIEKGTKNVEDNDPTLYVSNKNAIITKMIAAKGYPVVKKGDFVKKGALLILGEKNIDEENKIYIKADGKILGKCNYFMDIEKELKKEIKYFTGRKFYELKLKAFDFITTFVEYEEQFENYVMKSKKLPLINKYITMNVYEEYLLNEEEIDESTALSEIKKICKENILKENKRIYEVLDVKIKYTKDEEKGIIKANCIVNTIEDIGVKKKYKDYSFNTSK